MRPMRTEALVARAPTSGSCSFAAGASSSSSSRDHAAPDRLRGAASLRARRLCQRDGHPRSDRVPARVRSEPVTAAPPAPEHSRREPLFLLRRRSGSRRASAPLPPRRRRGGDGRALPGPAHGSSRPPPWSCPLPLVRRVARLALAGRRLAGERERRYPERTFPRGRARARHARLGLDRLRASTPRSSLPHRRPGDGARRVRRHRSGRRDRVAGCRASRWAIASPTGGPRSLTSAPSIARIGCRELRGCLAPLPDEPRLHARCAQPLPRDARRARPDRPRRARRSPLRPTSLADLRAAAAGDDGRRRRLRRLPGPRRLRLGLGDARSRRDRLALRSRAGGRLRARHNPPARRRRTKHGDGRCRDPCLRHPRHRRTGRQSSACRC